MRPPHELRWQTRLAARKARDNPATPFTPPDMKLSPLFSSLALALTLACAPVHAATGPGVSWQAAAADADIDRALTQADRKSVV